MTLGPQGKDPSGGSLVQELHLGQTTWDLSVPHFLICKMGTNPVTANSSQEARDSAWCTAGADMCVQILIDEQIGVCPGEMPDEFSLPLTMMP